MSVTSSYDSLSPAELRRRGTQKWNAFDEDVLALWVAEMDYPTAPAVLDVLREAVERESFGYPRSDDQTGIADATARWWAMRYGVAIEPAQVHVLPDVMKGVELAVEYFSPPSSPIILPTPAYMPFFEIPRLVRRPVIEVPMALSGDRFVLDLDGIEQAFAEGGFTLILCNPYNPLGRAFEADELRSLAEVVERNGGRVVADEIHGPITYGRRHVPYSSVSGLAAGHSLTVVSASKGWNLPGLKCAQAITTNHHDQVRWRQIPRLASHGASTIGIDANVAAYRFGGPWLDETLAYLDQNRLHLAELLDELLPEVVYRMPQATYLAWLDFSALGLPVEPAEFFLEHARVAMNPGLAFGRNGRGCTRLNFATSRAILEQAVESMARAVGENR